MALTIGVERPSTPLPTPAGAPVRKEPVYDLYLQDVDALVSKILEVTSTNPTFFLGFLRPSAREYLLERNEYR